MADEGAGLDPKDWGEMRALGHRMMDDMIDHLAGIRGRPVWRKMPEGVRAAFRAPLPGSGMDVGSVYEEFSQSVQPYVTGNTHPRFMGWVHGGGTPVSMLAELLAGAMNANCGGRDHVGIAVERQVIAWAAEMVGMPAGTGGVLLTGSSMANFCAVLCAKYKLLGHAGRRNGIGGRRLVAYASTGVHRCVPGALDMAGLGLDSLRKIPVDADYRMEISALNEAIARDRAEGLTPFMVVGTAGSVDVGAIDDLNAIANVAYREKIWFHADAAFGALACLSPTLKPRLKGIERADSVAFDFHKWAQVTYDAGCALVRDAELQRATFAQSTSYLAHAARGLAGGEPWPCDLGPDLSRGFRALKIWMTISAYGANALGAVVDQCCDVAQHLAAQINKHSQLTLSAPVPLNIVCFHINDATDDETAALVADLQETGAFAPSTTTIDNRLAIRAAIVNHRTTRADVDGLVEAVVGRLARKQGQGGFAPPGPCFTASVPNHGPSPSRRQ
jgi:glutamate/tyrosine decarboxylase-like PLP-dependent enzyme